MIEPMRRPYSTLYFCNGPNGVNLVCKHEVSSLIEAWDCNHLLGVFRSGDRGDHWQVGQSILGDTALNAEDLRSLSPHTVV
jgi:hypothetical protein